MSSNSIMTILVYLVEVAAVLILMHVYNVGLFPSLGIVLSVSAINYIQGRTRN